MFKNYRIKQIFHKDDQVRTPFKDLTLTCHDIFWCRIAMGPEDSSAYMSLGTTWAISGKPKVRKFCVVVLFQGMQNLLLKIERETGGLSYKT